MPFTIALAGSMAFANATPLNYYLGVGADKISRPRSQSPFPLAEPFRGAEIQVVAPQLAIAKSHAGNFHQGDAADTYTITVSNADPARPTGPVTVGHAADGPDAYGGGQRHDQRLERVELCRRTVTAMRSDVLAAGTATRR